MPSVHDVAAKIINHFAHGITTMKLQKLSYFSLGWGYALLQRQLFPEQFQAWRNGPVCYELFDEHRRKYVVDDWPSGDESRLEPEEVIVIEAVLRNFGALSGPQLSELTHEPGTPWDRIRQENGVGAGQRFAGNIPPAYIEEYFAELTD